jgi:Ca2+-binding EF-hand superfamily protein
VISAEELAQVMSDLGENLNQEEVRKADSEILKKKNKRQKNKS